MIETFKQTILLSSVFSMNYIECLEPTNSVKTSLLCQKWPEDERKTFIEETKTR